MICPKQLVLQSYFDEELSPRRMRAIKKHLENCEHCRNQIIEWDRFLRQMQQVLTPIDGIKVNPTAKHWSSRKHLKLIAAAAAIVITIGFSAMWAFEGFGHQENVRHSRRILEDTRETELMKEYLILHLEESDSYGGSDV